MRLPAVMRTPTTKAHAARMKGVAAAAILTAMV